MRHSRLLFMLVASACSAVVLFSLGSTTIVPVSLAAPPPAAGPIRAENQQQGSTGWQSPELARGRGGSLDEEDGRSPARSSRPAPTAGAAAAPAAPVWTDTAIRGYASQTSIQHGQPIAFMVSTSLPSYDIEVYRMGWYGGTGASLKLAARGLTGQNQPVPQPQADSGLVEATWQPSYTLQTDPTWTSGVYLAKLIGSTGTVSYIIFVVRADEQPADIVYQLPVSTYEAYNNWGGKSLYGFNSEGNTAAAKVSFDRPYGDWSGAGSFFDGDYNMVRFLESQSYNLTYTTSTDTQTSPALLGGRKVFLSPWHDEYWSKPMRDNVTAARDRGMSLTFFDANAVYWQIRWENSTSGTANRVITCYKLASTDPMSSTNPSLTTVQWRQAPVNQPENALLGAMYESYFPYGQQGAPWVVQNSSNWVYAGTGVKDGDSIAGLVGYEYDRVWNNGLTPPGETVLSASPVTDLNGINSIANGTLYTTASGALVVDVGTVYWAWKLDDNAYQNHGADARVQRMTNNILARAITAPPTPSLPIYTDALASGWVNYSFNTTVNFAATTPVYAGSKSLAFTVTKRYGGLYLHTATGITTSGPSGVTFALYASQAGQVYGVTLQTTGDTQIGNEVLLANAGGDPVAGTWKVYTIPLSAFGATGATIGGITIQDEGNKAEPVAYVDELRLIGAADPTPPPSVSGISPAGGPAAGGTSVTITGANLQPASGSPTVLFGTAAATSVSCSSATSCTAISPAGSGTVHVTVAVGTQTSASSAADQFTYAACVPAKADITSPSGGSITAGTPTFQWGGGGCVTQYYLYVGSNPGANDLYSAGPLPATTTSATVSPAIPVDGRTIYVRLWSVVNGGYQAVDHSYLMGTCSSPHQADITVPSGGSVTSSTPTFQWGGGSCVTQYYLYVGSSFGQNDLYSAGPLPATTTSATVSPAIPVDGRTIYVRLWSLVNGQFQSVDHSYLMGACNNPSQASISSPTPGTLHGASQTFQWTGGACVTQYYLYIGSSFGQADLYSSGPLAGTVTSQTVTGLPTSGSTIYVRLWSLVNGTYLAVDDSYVTGP